MLAPMLNLLRCPLLVGVDIAVHRLAVVAGFNVIRDPGLDTPRPQPGPQTLDGRRDAGVELATRVLSVRLGGVPLGGVHVVHCVTTR